MNNVLIKLPYRFMYLQGPDAEKFLQGQCTIDINELTSDTFSFGTFNDPKGRMYCLFKAIRYDNGILLSVHHSLYEHTLTTLNKYKVFFKCDIKEIELISYGFSINEKMPKDAPAEVNQLIEQLTHQTFINNHPSIGLRIPNSELVELWLPCTMEVNSREADEDWLIRLCKAGIPQLDSSTKEKFILQELNLQELGAVSFKKGCYTGQEIIARMKYLGKQKKRMFLLESEASIQASSLDKVHDTNGKKLGTIVCGSSSTEAGSAYLAVLNTEAVENATQALVADHQSGLNIKHLIYEI